MEAFKASTQPDTKPVLKIIPKSELGTLSQILDALDVHQGGPTDLRADDESHMRIVCWDKPANEIEQALEQMSARYQDALKN